MLPVRFITYLLKGAYVSGLAVCPARVVVRRYDDLGKRHQRVQWKHCMYNHVPVMYLLWKYSGPCEPLSFTLRDESTSLLRSGFDSVWKPVQNPHQSRTGKDHGEVLFGIGQDGWFWKLTLDFQDCVVTASSGAATSSTVDNSGCQWRLAWFRVNLSATDYSTPDPSQDFLSV
nr:hypothetical protein CFP56_31489 [Quercus suber]